MNKNIILQIGLGLSLSAVAVLLIENREQQSTINRLNQNILQRKRWMDIAVRILNRAHLPNDEREQLMIDLESYLIMRHNKII